MTGHILTFHFSKPTQAKRAAAVLTSIAKLSGVVVEHIQHGNSGKAACYVPHVDGEDPMQNVNAVEEALAPMPGLKGVSREFACD